MYLDNILLIVFLFSFPLIAFYKWIFLWEVGLLESPEFCDMIKFCNPSAFIPSADTIHNDILKLFKNHQSIIKHELQVNI